MSGSVNARYYDPVIWRFYSNDPVGYTASNPVMSFNRYLYVNNNPYKYTDPDGEFIQFVSAVIGAFTAATAYQEANPKASKMKVAIAGIGGGVAGFVTGSGVTALISKAVTTVARIGGSSAAAASTAGTVASEGLASSIVAGSASGAATSAGTQVVTTGKVDGGEVVAAAINGAAVGSIAGAPLAALTPNASGAAKDLAKLIGSALGGGAELAQIEDKKD